MTYAICVESSVNIRTLLLIVGPIIWSLEAADVAFLHPLAVSLAGPGSSGLPICKKAKMLLSSVDFPHDFHILYFSLFTF
jgi:hypothetical protein